MSQPTNKRDIDGERDEPVENDIPSGHEADTGDGEEEADPDSPNTGDRRPGGI